MKFENTHVFNIENAIRGMRNPLESWDKSDSKIDTNHVFILGEKDKELARKLIKAGSEHRKFLRQIFISVDITAPIFWYKEFDTYKVGTVANSTSTMHKLTSSPIDFSRFELDEDTLSVLSEPEFTMDIKDDNGEIKTTSYVAYYIEFLNALMAKYNSTKDKKYWRELVRWLPQGWLQTRTVTMNYENVINMIHQRSGHKLREWSEDFINWAKSLPYYSELLDVTE